MRFGEQVLAQTPAVEARTLGGGAAEGLPGTCQRRGRARAFRSGWSSPRARDARLEAQDLAPVRPRQVQFASARPRPAPEQRRDAEADDLAGLGARPRAPCPSGRLRKGALRRARRRRQDRSARPAKARAARGSPRARRRRRTNPSAWWRAGSKGVLVRLRDGRIVARDPARRPARAGTDALRPNPCAPPMAASR